MGASFDSEDERLDRLMAGPVEGCIEADETDGAGVIGVLDRGGIYQFIITRTIEQLDQILEVNELRPFLEEVIRTKHRHQQMWNLTHAPGNLSKQEGGTGFRYHRDPSRLNPKLDDEFNEAKRRQALSRTIH